MIVVDLLKITIGIKYSKSIRVTFKNFFYFSVCMDERNFSIEELKRVLDYAGALKSLETDSASSRISDKIQLKDHDLFTLTEIIEISEGVNVPEEYTRKAIERLCPTKEIQLQYLLENNAKPGISTVIIPTYKENLLQALYNFLPCEDFVCEEFKETNYLLRDVKCSLTPPVIARHFVDASLSL